MAGESRSVVVRLTAETAQYIASMQAAGTLTAGAMTKAEAATMRQSAALDTLGTKAGKVGAVAAVGLGAMAKAAIDWESQWAGVEKTVDGTTSQMADLEAELRGLATTMPATHQEIAGVAEAAGQLGVAREDISGFTETMVQLGESTTLTAEDAATAIAQMTNVMGTAPADVDNLASSLVAVGNAGASTERQIIEMAQGISGAAAVVGLAESDVLGIANAVASAGIEVEAGGSSISRVLTDMAKATAQGGDDLEAFAQVAGVSAEEFARSFEQRPAEALTSFIAGLGQMSASGQDVFTVLDQLGLSDVRVSRALLSMAADSEKFAGSLDLAGEAWDENTALTEEYGKRAETTASQAAVAWNEIKDAGISAGNELLPVIADIANVVGDAASAFGKLPAPVQSSLTGLLAITAVLGGGVWFTSKVIGGITSTNAALAELATTSPRAARGLADVGKAGLAIAALEGTALILKGITDQFKTPIDTSTLTRDLEALADGRVTGGLEDISIWLDDIGDKWERDWNPISRLSPFDPSGYEDAERGLGEIDKQLAALVEGGNAEQAAALFDTILQKARETGASTDDVVGFFTNYRTALDNVADAEHRAGLSDTLAGVLDVTGDAAAGAADDLDDFTDSAGDATAAMNQLAGHLDREQAWRDYGDAIKETKEALKDGFQEKDEETIAGIGREIVNITETLNKKPAQQRSALQQAKDDLEAFIESNPKAKAEFADLLTYVNRALDDLDNSEATPGVSLEDGQFRNKAETVERRTKALDFLEANPGADLLIDQFAAAFNLTKKDLAWLDRAKAEAELDADPSGVYRGIGLARDALNSFDGTTVTTYVATRHLASENADGGFYQDSIKTYASGGWNFGKGPAVSRHPMMVQGGANILWGEPETGWEAYISGKPSERNRNIDILSMAASRLGVAVTAFAGGGSIISGPGAAPPESWFGPDPHRGGRDRDPLDALVASIRELKRQLALDGKRALDDKQRKIAELQLKAAEKQLEVAKRTEEKLKERISNLRDIGRDFSTGSIVPDLEPTTALGNARAEVAAFRREILAAGGVWSKSLVRWSKELFAASSALDGTRAALERETQRRDDLVTALDEQRRALDELESTMASFGSAVSNNFLSSPFNKANRSAAPSAELAAAEAQLAAIRNNPAGDSVAAAAQASALIEQIRVMRQQSEAQEMATTGLQALDQALRGDIAAIDQFTAALDTLEAKGLDTSGALGALYQALAESGDYQTAYELSQLTAGQIDEYEKLFATREDRAAQLAAKTTQAVYGTQHAQQMAAYEAQQKVLESVEANIAALNDRAAEQEAAIRAIGNDSAQALKPQIDKLRADVQDVGRDVAERFRRMGIR